MNFFNKTRLAVVKRSPAFAGKARYFPKSVLLIAIGILYLPSALSAMAQDSTYADTSWSLWFRSQVSQHPDVIAAKEKMYAALATADSLDQPLYNPELDTAYEREGRANNFRVGLSQTLDWWGKRDVQKQQAINSRALGQREYELAIQQKSAEALKALVNWNAAQEQSRLALRQEEQLGTLLDLVEGRQRSGDLGQVDVELAFLGLSQKLNEAAQAQARFRQAEAQLQELLPDWTSPRANIPEALWLISEQKDVDQWVDQHPSVTAARAQWEMTKKNAELARLKGKAEPTVGLNGGKNAGDTIVGVTVSIPLNLRNNYSAETRAAGRQALAAEANYRSVWRKQQAEIRASAASLSEYQKRYQRWQGLMKGRGESSENLLEKQWNSGDLSTTEYLLALQQRTEGLVAGIELNTQYQLARIEWLLQSGQMETALMQVKR